MKKKGTVSVFIIFLQVLGTVMLFVFPASGEITTDKKENDTVILTGATIEQMKVHSMVDLLNTIPGINASRNMVKFRGFNTKKILVLLDGREMNDPTSSMRIVNWSRISVSDIEKLEILKGGAGGLYGDHAAGGLIRISTKKIKSGLHGSMEGRLGSFDSHRFEGSLNKRRGVFGLNLSGYREKTDGARSNSGETEYKLGSRLQYFQRSGFVSSLSADYSHSNAENSGPTYRLTPNANSQEETLGVSFVMPWHAVKSETHYNLFDKKYENPDADYVSQIEIWSLKERILWSPSIASAGTFDAGVDLTLNHVAGLNITSRSEESIGFYGGKKFSINGFPFETTPVTATIGMRGDFYSEFSAAFSPNLQLVYNPEWADITFSVARFNTIPDLRRRFYNTSTFRGNPDLKAETGTNYSLGFSRKILDSIELSVALFYNQVNDRISYERQGTIGTYENIGSSVKKGLESSLKWEPTEQIRFSFSYSYLNAKDEQTGTSLTYSPEHEVVIDIGITPFPDFFVGSVLRYKSKSYSNFDNTGTLAGTHFRINLRAEYTFWEKYAMFARAENVLDADFHIIDGYPVDPFNITVGVKYNF